MSLIGVSMLEMRQMIEQACLPDRCEVSCPDGENLTIRLGRGESLDDCLTVTGVPVASLKNCHDLLELVTRIKAQRHSQTLEFKAIA
ncbi:DUF1652 domain-containing protein [Pseudomonas sp. GD03858]|uniref:DUF1652 domain-containing protein n=1 Tax=unclassified Pseudomonas TaxID=196821 RepID=UPI00244A9A37|nr:MULTISPECIES: DUF1652 domain-containing protein [unclassified Pseudomonas]MDH0647650.1 DUF1652 domain-containing protein [Pseudomonas sp. GD03867]MDH0662770.1 DUF1652 domain-containing protein [Pseudomonas sp. GD03858]